jgi:hypothetical protein
LAGLVAMAACWFGMQARADVLLGRAWDWWSFDALPVDRLFDALDRVVTVGVTALAVSLPLVVGTSRRLRHRRAFGWAWALLLPTGFLLLGSWWDFVAS